MRYTASMDIWLLKNSDYTADNFNNHFGTRQTKKALDSHFNRLVKRCENNQMKFELSELPTIEDRVTNIEQKLNEIMNQITSIAGEYQLKDVFLDMADKLDLERSQRMQENEEIYKKIKHETETTRTIYNKITGKLKDRLDEIAPIRRLNTHDDIKKNLIVSNGIHKYIIVEFDQKRCLVWVYDCDLSEHKIIKDIEVAGFEIIGEENE